MLIEKPALPDDGLINRSAPDAMQDWVKLLGVEEARILIAVAVVGPCHDAVRRYLQVPALPYHSPIPEPSN